MQAWMSEPGGVEVDTKRVHRASQVTQPSHSVIWRTLMDPRTQFCHNPDCSDRGVVGEENIVIHSRAAQRYQCRRCKRTFR
jgi:hypothetical protein